MNKKTLLKNPAVPVRDESGTIPAKEKFSDCCADPLLFAMQDNFHQFSMGLFTILQCLRVAEENGHVPHLPEDWWVQLAVRYNLRI
ncbi:MAG: XRE family transcriptional regulator [Desulfovibrio sp.]|nr:XRE family transcriptional regulator [Desulfovibrio sp.]